MWSQIFPMSQSNLPSEGQEAEEFGATAGASCGGALKTPLSAKILSRGEGAEEGWGAASLSRWSHRNVVFFHPPFPNPWVSPAALSRPSQVPKKQTGMKRRGRGCGFNHKLSRQRSLST